MMVLMLGNFLQIMIWGVLFMVLGEFERVVRGGVPLRGELQLAGLWRRRDEPSPGSCWARSRPANGVLMFGLTGAALMAILQQMIKAQAEKGGSE